MIQISDGEGTSLKDFIEYHFLDSIRNDPEIDSLLYVWNCILFGRSCFFAVIYYNRGLPTIQNFFCFYVYYFNSILINFSKLY